MNESKPTLILGASAKPARISLETAKRLISLKEKVYLVGRSGGEVGSLTIHKTPQEWKDVHTITMYLGAKNQLEYYDYIFSLNPKRIIFNPGAENNELYRLSAAKGIMVENACTLVMLGTRQY